MDKQGRVAPSNGKSPVIRCVSRAFSVLEVLSQEGSLPLRTLAERLELPASTVHRILSSLLGLGYVRQDAQTGSYSLDLKVATLGSAALQQLDLRERARPILKELAETTGETTNLVVMHLGEVVYVERAEGSEMIRAFSRIGTRAPAHATAAGKVLLSDLSLREQMEVIKQHPLTRLTSRTITDPAHLIQELNQARSRGYALDDEECELGARCISAPVRDYSGKSVGAISISGPASRLHSTHLPGLINKLLKGTLKLSRTLGMPSEAEALYTSAALAVSDTARRAGTFSHCRQQGN